MQKWQIREQFNLGSSKSGHYGHKGIPGHQGGSASSGGGMSLESVVGLVTENSPVSTNLRQGRELDETERAIVNALDSSMSPMIEDVVLHRVVNIKGPDQAKAIYGTSSRLKEGDTFDDRGYASTTDNIKTLRTFAKEGASYMRIHLKKGQKALDLRGKGNWGTEGEVLMPRGTTFRVVGRSWDEKTERSWLELEVQ